MTRETRTLKTPSSITKRSRVSAKLSKTWCVVCEKGSGKSAVAADGVPTREETCDWMSSRLRIGAVGRKRDALDFSTGTYSFRQRCADVSRGLKFANIVYVGHRRWDKVFGVSHRLMLQMGMLLAI